MPEINVGNLKFHYQLRGAGEPLVFIHGLGSTGEDWEPQIENFAKDYQVLAYDVRGHGQSDKPKGPYSVAMFAADLAGLLEKLELSPAHVVGMSMGGWIAFEFAAKYAQQVRSLTIVNSGPTMIPKTFKQRLNIWQRLILFRVFNMRKIGEIIAGRLFIKPEQEELRQTFIEQWAKNDKAAYMAATRSALGWSVEERLGEIRMPALVVAAAEDYSPVADKEAYVAQMPNARLVVVEDSRHATQVEHPEEFNRLLAEFLSGLER